MSANAPRAAIKRTFREVAFWATSELMHRSKQPNHSITSSAGTSSVGGINVERAMTVRNIAAASEVSLFDDFTTLAKRLC